MLISGHIFFMPVVDCCEKCFSFCSGGVTEIVYPSTVCTARESNFIV